MVAYLLGLTTTRKKCPDMFPIRLAARTKHGVHGTGFPVTRFARISVWGSPGLAHYQACDFLEQRLDGFMEHFFALYLHDVTSLWGWDVTVTRYLVKGTRGQYDSILAATSDMCKGCIMATKVVNVRRKEYYELVSPLDSFQGGFRPHVFTETLRGFVPVDNNCGVVPFRLKEETFRVLSAS